MPSSLLNRHGSVRPRPAPTPGPAESGNRGGTVARHRAGPPIITKFAGAAESQANLKPAEP